MRRRYYVRGRTLTLESQFCLGWTLSYRALPCGDIMTLNRKRNSGICIRKNITEDGINIWKFNYSNYLDSVGTLSCGKDPPQRTEPRGARVLCVMIIVKVRVTPSYLDIKWPNPESPFQEHHAPKRGVSATLFWSQCIACPQLLEEAQRRGWASGS
ncbi:hypothetical protein V1477_014977 [Vespula maculifrons]|uniref:Uncharacterized protein n=1 Tax=Vespula maculifrons TaxID=7453 RepID=A0ABD2BIZ7_VESMC